MLFLLDANALIEANKRYYAKDICPAFWDFLDAKSNDIKSIKSVYDELLKGNDELVNWAKERKELFLSVDDKGTQIEFGGIASFLSTSKYAQSKDFGRFMGGADPWIIAKAKLLNATVVTHEKSIDNNAKRPKIPNICADLGVKVVNTFDLIRINGGQFIL